MWRFSKKNIAIASAALIILLVVLIRSCGSEGEKVYIYEKASRADVHKTITVTGELDVLDPVVIMSRTSGVIEKVNVDFNQQVSKGQLLMKFDSSIIEQKVMKAASLLESAKLEIESARKELESRRNLFADNLISKRAMEQAEIEYSVVQSRYKQVKIDYDIALKERECAYIYSPISGVVIAVYKKRNDSVTAAMPLILLAPCLKKMTLTISIDESDIGNVKNGQLVQFSVSAYPEKKFNGTISQVRINPVKSGGLVTYQALVLCDNDETLLKPGMTATATVVLAEKKNVISVLNQAFMVNPGDETDYSSEGRYLYKKEGIIGDKTYKRIAVKTGLTGDMRTEITEGVREGDEIMVKIK